jgi:hypothetical protein
MPQHQARSRSGGLTLGPALRPLFEEEYDEAR